MSQSDGQCDGKPAWVAKLLQIDGKSESRCGLRTVVWRVTLAERIDVLSRRIEVGRNGLPGHE